MKVEHISHTAHWMAYMRAVESERPDALFQDPYSLKLAGTFGKTAADTIGNINTISNAIAIRTALLDRLILEATAHHGVDLVINLGSGLDTRPWRLNWPARLRWRDVDLPELLEHKARVLANDPPTCRYESFAADILDLSQRAAALDVHPIALRVLVVTEGLLVYLHPDQVQSIALDLHDRKSCRWWLTDLIGPRALQALRNVWAPTLPTLGFHFAPTDSAGFFARLGWRETAFHSAREEATRFNRAPRISWLGRLGLMLGTPSFREEFRRLAGIASFARVDQAP